MRKIILVLFIALFLSGCGFVVKNINEADSKGLRYGMPKQEVINLLGTPQKESMLVMDGKEYDVLQYPLEVEKTAKINTLPTNYFRVFFLDGKLVQWEKDKVIAQPAYKYPETIIPGREVRTIEKTSEPKQYLK